MIAIGFVFFFFSGKAASKQVSLLDAIESSSCHKIFNLWSHVNLFLKIDAIFAFNTLQSIQGLQVKPAKKHGNTG